MASVGLMRPATRRAIPPLVARRANDRVEYGFDLAQRGAFYSARAEFLGALHMIAQAFDQMAGTTANRRWLTAGLRALQEASDFVARDTVMSTSVDLATIVSSHQTPVLAGVELTDVSTAVALQRYFEYAKERLAQAGGSEPVASMAIYGLARIEPELGRQYREGGVGVGCESIALHQAALMVDPGNYRAANDLGVLLARFGQLEQARTTLSHSLEIHNHPSTWKSLSIVHRRLGQVELARRASQASQRMTEQQRPPAAGPSSRDPDESVIRWVDVATFTSHSKTNDMEPVASTSPRGRPAVNADRKAKSLFSKMLSKFQGKSTQPGPDVEAVGRRTIETDRSTRR